MVKTIVQGGPLQKGQISAMMCRHAKGPVDVSLKIPTLRLASEMAIIERYYQRESSVEQALIEM